MCPHALIPFKPTNPKTRLSCLLNQEEREAFARAMLEDVIFAVRDANCSPVIVGTELFDSEDVQVTIENTDLSGSLNSLVQQSTGEPLLVIMADIPLANAESIRRVIKTEKEMAVVPGRGGGTNVVFVKDPKRFQFDYYGTSFIKHKNIAEKAGLSFEAIDSFRLHTDIDEREDLVELLIHGDGKSRKYLEALGFELIVEKGRVGVVRNEKK